MERKPDTRQYYRKVRATKEDDRLALAHYLDDLWYALQFGGQKERDMFLKNSKRNRNRIRMVGLFGDPEQKTAARDVLRLIGKDGFWSRAGKMLKETLLGKK